MSQKYSRPEPDEAMVLRLLAGPCRDAGRADKQAAIERLLQTQGRPSYSQIATRVGVTKRTVERRAHAIGVAGPPRPHGETRARVLELHRQGLHAAAIGRVLGIDRTGPARHIRALRQQGVL